MKKLLYILPFLLLPFMVAGQESNTEETVKKEVDNYKNQIDLGIEILAPSFSYRRKTSNKTSIGISSGFGFPIAFPWNNRRELNFRNVVAESFHIGLILNYKISEKWDYVFSPQYSIFSSSDGSDGLNLDPELSTIGARNTIFIRVKKIQIGISLYIGYLNIGYREDGLEITYFRKLTMYNSFFKLRIPLKQW